MTSDITVEHSEGLAVVSLNRPDKLNALTLDMRVELLDAFRDIQTDPGFAPYYCGPRAALFVRVRIFRPWARTMSGVIGRACTGRTR